MPVKSRFCVAVAAGAGLYGAALLLSPGAGANPLHPLPTGGPGCFEQQAAFGAAAAPVVLPGPAAGAVPLAPIVPPVPVVPPVPPVVPPVPLAPVVPVAGAGAAGIADAGAPITMAAGTGKGAPTGAASKAAEPVVVPGPPPAPVAAEPAPAPIPAVLAGVATAVPACGAVLAPTR